MRSTTHPPGAVNLRSPHIVTVSNPTVTRTDQTELVHAREED